MEILGYITLSIMGLVVVGTFCYIAIRECEIAKIKAKNTYYHINISEVE